MSTIVSEQREQLKRERLEDARVRRTEARDRASRLKAAEDARHRRNQAEHMRGEHVGIASEMNDCMDCKFWGDLPLLGLDGMNSDQLAQLRAEFLERNIARTIEQMRFSAAIGSLERELDEMSHAGD